MSNPLHDAMDLKDAGKCQEAIQLLDEHIKSSPNDAQAFFERGHAKFEIDDHAGALVDFDRALAIDPEFPGARDWKARVLADLGEDREAAKERLANLRQNPNGPHPGMGVSPRDWTDCAASFLKSGDPQTARELLEEYFEDHAAGVTHYKVHGTAPMRMLSRLYLDAGEIDRAAGFAKQAFDHEHSCPADEELHGIILATTGEIDDARKIYSGLTAGLPSGIDDYMTDLRDAITRAEQAGGDKL